MSRRRGRSWKVPKISRAFGMAIGAAAVVLVVLLIVFSLSSREPRESAADVDGAVDARVSQALGASGPSRLSWSQRLSRGREVIWIGTGLVLLVGLGGAILWSRRGRRADDEAEFSSPRPPSAWQPVNSGTAEETQEVVNEQEAQLRVIYPSPRPEWRLDLSALQSRKDYSAELLQQPHAADEFDHDRAIRELADAVSRLINAVVDLRQRVGDMGSGSATAPVAPAFNPEQVVALLIGHPQLGDLVKKQVDEAMAAYEARAAAEGAGQAKKAISPKAAPTRRSAAAPRPLSPAPDVDTRWRMASQLFSAVDLDIPQSEFETQVDALAQSLPRGFSLGRDTSPFREDAAARDMAIILTLASSRWVARSDSVTITDRYRPAFERFVRDYAGAASDFELIWPEPGEPSNDEVHEISRIGDVKHEAIRGVRRPGLLRGDQVVLRAKVALG